MSRRLSLAVRCLALGFLVACGSEPDTPTIGLITKTESNPYFVQMREGAQRVADSLGLRLLTGAGTNDGDNASQVTAVENMIAAGARVILITVNDAKAIVPTLRRAREQGVVVIALDSPPDPRDAVDALFATDNYEAGQLIGRYARARLGDRAPRAATLDLLPGHPVGAQRHNGFLRGLGLPAPGPQANTLGDPPAVACMADTYGNQARGQTAMESCLQKDSAINVVYAINEPSAAGAARAIEAAGRADRIVLVTVDGGCDGVREVQQGRVAATAQQYPVRMAELGVAAAANYIRSGQKPTGFTDTGVTLIAGDSVAGVASEGVVEGFTRCF